MSKKQWFLLWLIFMSYLFLGATVFYYLERKLELERRHIVRGEQEEIEDLLRLNYASDAPQAQEQILLRLAEYCGKPFSTKKMTTKEVDGNATATDHNATATDRNSTDATCDDDPDSDVTCEDEKPIRWTFYNSFFFALTTLSTIGYGNLSPTSMEGRLLVICYSLIGIPLNGIVLSQLGECFGSTFMRVHHRYKTHHFETKLSLIMDIIMYLIPGVVFFIFIPSGFFVYFEGWTFDESIYYAFVTLTTIGYGDFVAGQTGSDNPWYNIYKVLLIIWFMFGLGYLVMILGFIARAMQSKKIARLEQAVTQTLKQTQNKIWKEFTHEVTVVRRALNEMYLLKVKPVYRDGAEVGPLLGSKRLSRSAPQLSEWPVLRPREPQQDSGEDLEAEEDLEAAFRAKRLQRRQAFSENVLKARPQRTASDGDLTLIDRTATFRSATPVEPGLLLARIVDAIGTPIPVRGHDSASESGSDDYRPPKYSGGYGDGINMFSDSDILASEWGEDNRDRSRTQSAVLSPPPYHSDYDEQRTWSGNEYNHYKNNLSHDPMPSKDGVWSQSDQLLAPARGLRRMSMAAINFFTPAARWVKRSSLQKSNPDIHQHQNQQQTKTRERKISSYGKARTRQPGINRHASDGYLKKHRYSLQDNGHVRRSEDEQVVDDSVNYLSYTTGRRPSLLAALAREMGPKRDSTSSISPVLEQTSVADFIRVLTTLHDNQDHERDHSMTICNGDTTRRASSRRLFRSTSTLDNYRRAEAVNPSLVTSDAAFTPTQTASDVRRRRFSFVPTLSSFSTNEKPPVKKLSTEGLFQRRRSRSQSVSPVDSSLSLAAMPAPVDRRIRRMSSSGSKDKSFLGRRSFSVMASPRGPPPPLLKTLTPPRLVITSPEGHEQGTEHSRFTVSQADSSVAIQKQDDPAAGSNNQQSASVAWQASPSQDATSNDEKDSLTDVVVVKL